MDSRLSGNTDSVTDIQMSGDPHLSTQLNTVPDFATARDTGLCDDYAPFTDSHVVPDLHQIINPRTRAYKRIRTCATVDRRIRAYLDTVLNQNPSELRNGDGSSGRNGESESRLSNPDPRKQRDMIPDHRNTYRYIGTDRAVVSKYYPVTDIGIRSDTAIRSDYSIRTDDRPGADNAPCPDTCRWMNQRV